MLYRKKRAAGVLSLRGEQAGGGTVEQSGSESACLHGWVGASTHSVRLLWHADELRDSSCTSRRHSESDGGSGGGERRGTHTCRTSSSSFFLVGFLALQQKHVGMPSY